MAEYYFADLAQKVSRGMTNNALKGLFNGGVCPIGYMKGPDGKFAIEESGAKIVREIFDLYGKQGYTIPYIAEKYEGTGILRPNGKLISKGSVLCILKNEKYVGVYTFHDVRNENGIPPIVDRETFDLVQDRLAKNARCPRIASEDHDFILTGKLRCGKCGQIMSAEESNKKHSEKHYAWYICSNKKRKHTCDMKTVDKELLEQSIVQLITSRFDNPDTIGVVADKILSKQVKISPAMEALLKQLDDTKKKIKNLLSAIEAGIVNETTKSRMDELEMTKKSLEESIAKENLLHRAFTRDEILFMLTRFVAPTPKNLREKKTIIRLLLDSAVLFPDGTLTLSLNWLKGEKPIDIDVFRKEFTNSTIQNLCSPY